MAAQEKNTKKLSLLGIMWCIASMGRGGLRTQTSNTDHRVVDDIEMAHARM